MKKAYSYLRFSTPEQSKGDSFRRQFKLAQDYAAQHNLDLDETLNLCDEGVSAYRGKHVETGKLGDFLQEVREGRVERGSVLLVESLDRISRQSARKALRVLEDICEEGITVVTLTDGRKYDEEALESDPMALMMSLMVFIRANEESATKATRLKSAWATKRQQIGDRPMTAKAPLWLHLDKKAGKFQVIEERAALVRRMFNMYLEGTGPSGIAKEFNREGLKPWGIGALWHESYVTKILNNPAVHGTFTPHRIEHDGGKKQRVPLDPIAGYFPAVMGEETFLRAQDLKKQKGLKGRKPTTTARNIFARLAKCPVCGSTMSWVNKSGPWQYLVCYRASNGAGCKYRSVPYDRLEQSFLEAVQGGLVLPVDGEKLRQIERELAEAENRMNNAIRERSNLIEAIKRGTMSDETVLHAYAPRMVMTGVIEEGPTYATKNVPWTLREEIEFLDMGVEENRKKIVKLRGQMNLIRPAAVEARLLDLEQAVREEEPNRAKINAALLSICKKVVVEYDRGAVVLHFKHTDLTLDVPAKMRAEA